MQPVASVIIPCYNVEPYLVSALESLQAQTFSDFEIIAIDDGSTDGTAALLANFAARETRLQVVSQTNRGVSAARNKGLDLARGRYVFFVDPDDTAHPEMLSKGISQLEKTGADCCIFAYRRRFGDQGEWQLMPLQADYTYASNTDIVNGFFPHMFGYSDAQARIWGRRGNWRAGREEGSVCRCVYRAETLQRANVRFDETIVLYEDAMFNCEFLLSAQSMTCLPEPLYDYTVRSQGAVTANNRSRALFTNKLRLLAKRQDLDERTGGRLWPLYSASCVFSALEMLHALFCTNVKLSEGLPLLRNYLACPAVRRALASFPLPTRRPLAALLLLLLRAIYRA
ncbi:MAG: glycosyltransferase [Kiritimatiellae bacterium]|nr:glycosyltransferase [Kiritimatiellia bacterium]